MTALWLLLIANGLLALGAGACLGRDLTLDPLVRARLHVGCFVVGVVSLCAGVVGCAVCRG